MILLSMTLSACTTPLLSNTTTTGTLIQQVTASVGTESVVKNKLAAGLLKLEGTSAEVTSEQADDLLFLWKGIKSLNGETNTASAEIAAIYSQIEETLNDDQVHAIKGMVINSTDINTLNVAYGITTTPGISAKTSSTTQTQSMEDGMPPDMGMGGGQGDMLGSNAAQTTKGSSSVKNKTVSAQVDTNIQLTDAVIKLLQQTIGSL